jgi:hypothetical protein
MPKAKKKSNPGKGKGKIRAETPATNRPTVALQNSEGSPMNNLPTPSSTDISSQIGALELGDNFASFDDGMLEAAGASMALGPTLGNFGCGAVPQTNYCVRYALLQMPGKSNIRRSRFTKNA